MNKSECIRLFNTNIIRLMKELENYYPTSGEIITLNNRIKILKNELGREKLIEICGPKIYTYKDKILKRDMDFFQDFNNIKKESNINEKEKNYELVSKIFMMASGIYPKLDEQKQDELYNKLLIMLQSYMAYKT